MIRCVMNSHHFKRGATEGLAATNCNDDFKFVPIGKQMCSKAAACHNLAIALDSDAFTGEFQYVDQVGNAERGLE